MLYIIKTHSQNFLSSIQAPSFLNVSAATVKNTTQIKILKNCGCNKNCIIFDYLLTRNKSNW